MNIAPSIENSTGLNKVGAGNHNTNFLKLLGLITMTIDHIGKIFAPDDLLWQMIGRLTFPLFAYCLVAGFLHTRSVNNYLKRLALLALVSQPFYVLAFDYKFYEPNIFFTLFLGLLSLHFFKQRLWIAYTLTFIVSFLINTDYGLLGLLLINCIYWFRD